MIHDKTLKTLEYDRVIARLAGFAATAIGRPLCQDLLPLADCQASQEALAETEDAVTRLLKYGELPFSGINDIRPCVRQAQAGAVLECGDFLRLAAFLRAVERMREEVRTHDPNLPPLMIDQKAGQLEALPGFRRRLEQCIRDDQDLFDQASDKLHQIRSRLREAQAAVRRELDRVLAKGGDALQENLITMRSGRYVVPVRSDRRGAIKGIVHDTSSTGSTLFIEPMAVVEQNNKIRELEVAEKQEIYEILKELSAIVANQAPLFMANVALLAQLDFAMAKAKLALDGQAHRPRLNQEGEIFLRQARHPLIPKDRVVPIDFELGKAFRTLVITGPNTGGKTVTLKTCGLLTLMAMAGLFVPASPDSELAFFPRIEADIGDEQSIEQNLSTFSSHMREIIRITGTAGPGTLVLLDELGAGTDPSEGAALAIAILDHLKASGCHTVATTHYRELKGYAMNEPGVENACCEFDTDTLKPTFKLLIGVPGVSNAFAISSRLGLSPQIIDSARSLISDEGARFEDLVSAIEQSHREARAMEEAIDRLREETEEARQELEAEREKLGRERARILDKARADAGALIEEAKESIDQLLVDIKDQASAAPSSNHRLASEARGRLAAVGKSFELKRPAGDEGSPGPVRPEDIVLGGRYQAKALGVTGLVRELPDAKQNVVLEAGSFRVTVPVSQLVPLGRKKPDNKKKAKAPLSATASLSSDIVMRTGAELMLLGKRVDEALGMIDHFLDDALLAGLSPVRIVHGKGTGALRQASHDFLARDRRVASFRQGGQGEGGDGVTVVELNLS